MKKITVTTQNDTRILSITVKDEDPYVASQMADAIRVAASDHIQNVMNTEAVNVVDEANIPDEPVSPSIKKKRADRCNSRGIYRDCHHHYCLSDK